MHVTMDYVFEVESSDGNTSNDSSEDFSDEEMGFLDTLNEHECLSNEEGPHNDTHHGHEDSYHKNWVDPLKHVSQTYFYFTRSTYDLMIRALLHDVSISLEDLKVCSPLLDLKSGKD